MFHGQFVTRNCRINEGSMNFMVWLGGLLYMLVHMLGLAPLLVPSCALSLGLWVYFLLTLSLSLSHCTLALYHFFSYFAHEILNYVGARSFYWIFHYVLRTITRELPLNPPPISTIFILGPCPLTLRPPPSRMVGPVTVNVFRRWERRRRDRFWCF